MQASDTPVSAPLVDRLRRLAWDVDFSAETVERHPEWMLQRVLDYGQWPDFEGLARHYGPERMQDLLGRVRCSTPRARSFSEVLRR